MAYIEKTTNIIDRIFHGWTAVFIFRFWCLWINKTEKQSLNDILLKLSNTSVPRDEYLKPKSKYFITYQSHFSVEINAHSLVYLAMLVSERQLPVEALKIWLQNSQTCEGIFRSARSISSTFSSGVNFTASQFLSQVNKLSTLQNIKNNQHLNSLRFPQHHKLSKTSSTISDISNSSIPSKHDIEQTVYKSFEYVLELISPLKIKGFVKDDGNTMTLKALSDDVSRHLDNFWSTEIELTDTTNESSTDTDSITPDSSDDDDAIESDEEPGSISTSSTLGFQGVRVFDNVKQEREHTYFKMNINNQTKFLHKQTATWLLEKDKKSLSADRVSRFRGV